MCKYNRSDKGSAAQGRALGTKSPGTALNLILFCSALSESEIENVRERY